MRKLFSERASILRRLSRLNLSKCPSRLSTDLILIFRRLKETLQDLAWSTRTKASWDPHDLQRVKCTQGVLTAILPMQMASQARLSLAAFSLSQVLQSKCAQDRFHLKKLLLCWSLILEHFCYEPNQSYLARTPATRPTCNSLQDKESWYWLSSNQCEIWSDGLWYQAD